MQDPTNVVGRRIIAYLIDALLVFAIYAFVWQSQAKYVDTDKVPGADCEAVEASTEVSQCFQINDRVFFITGGKAAAVGLVGLALSFGYFAALQGITGRTLGKLVTGIRTVNENGQPPGLGKGTLRWVLLIVDAFPYVAPLVGFICSLTSSGHRRVGDMAAKTFVVAKAAAGQPIAVPGLTTAGGYPPGGWAQPTGPGWGGPPTPAPPGAWGQPAEPAPSPWGAPAAPSEPSSAGWASPTGSAPIEPSTPEPSPVPAPSADGPQWDEARGTYIQWDPNQGKWLQWDESGRSWQVIPGQ